MSAGINAEFDPLLYAKVGEHIHGKLLLKDLPRLASMSDKPSTGWIDVDLQFSRDDSRRNWVQGRLQGQISVICQRCLERMLLDLDCEVRILLVSHSEGTAAGEEEESQYICQGKTKIANLIEDDLLLTMPMFPKHQPGDCHSFETGKEKGKTAGDQEENPFAVLANLKTGKKKDKRKVKK